MTIRDIPLGVILIPALIGCELPAPSRPVQPPPPHEIVATQDLSYSAARRYNLRVTLPDYYSQEEIERIAETIVADITDRERVNALSIMFYAPGTDTGGAWDVGMIEWAPNGQWADALSVDAGDYRSFRYNVTYRAPTRP